jgi:hypothetical protein
MVCTHNKMHKSQWNISIQRVEKEKRIGKRRIFQLFRLWKVLLFAWGGQKFKNLYLSLPKTHPNVKSKQRSAVVFNNVAGLHRRHVYIFHCHQSAIILLPREKGRHSPHVWLKVWGDAIRAAPRFWVVHVLRHVSGICHPILPNNEHTHSYSSPHRAHRQRQKCLFLLIGPWRNGEALERDVLSTFHSSPGEKKVILVPAPTKLASIFKREEPNRS